MHNSICMQQCQKFNLHLLDLLKKKKLHKETSKLQKQNKITKT